MANYPHNFPGHHFHGAYAGLNHDHDEYGGFHFDEYGPTYWGEIRCNFREKSAAASAREQEAKDAFLKLVASTPTNRTAYKIHFDLVGPSVHLTGPCWRDFRKFIENHGGWAVFRREIEAKLEAGLSVGSFNRGWRNGQRIGKRYTIEVYQHPDFAYRRALYFSLGLHPRCGISSPINVLDPQVVSMIFSFL